MAKLTVKLMLTLGTAGALAILGLFLPVSARVSATVFQDNTSMIAPGNGCTTRKPE